MERIRLFPINTKMEFFRARKGEYANSEIKDMLNPPACITNPGRCNPQGISYLYLSTDEETATAEVRGGNEIVTVARFEVDVLNIFSFLPFEQVYMRRFISDEKIKTLISIINAEMSQAFDEEDNGLSYIPLQFISEYIKKIGFDGFIYSSVVSKGKNLVMFNSEKAKILERYERKVD